MIGSIRAARSLVDKLVNMTTQSGQRNLAANAREQADGTSPKRGRIMFAMHHASFMRNFERTIVLLMERGFDVTLVISKKHKSIDPKVYDSIASKRLPLRILKMQRIPEADKRRVWRDAIFYASPPFRNAKSLRDRFAGQQKALIGQKQFERWMQRLDRLPEEARQRFEQKLALKEERAPLHRGAIDIIDDLQPDLLVVTPLVHFLSHEIEYLKVARQRGIPSVLAVASWDNLTNKGVIKMQPDLVAVWNEEMSREATSLHGVDPERIAITGAPVFDWWFESGDALPRADFLRGVGFDPDRRVPTLVYLCSSVSIASGSEVETVENWVRAIRASDDPTLRQANIIVRPHPMSTVPWTEHFAARLAGLSRKRDYTLYPADVAPPNAADQRIIFYNTVLHADAIIGLNTSAMIEATILKRPVFTFKGHGAEESQAANLHFRHLEQSGCVMVARDLGEHVAQLRDVLRDPDHVSNATTEFVQKFVRPLGRDASASLALADAITGVFEAKSQSERLAG